MTHILRRLNSTTLYLEGRAHEEEVLRQAAHNLTGGLTMKDVLHRITEATALLGQAEDVCIETVDPQRNEATCVAGCWSRAPADRNQVSLHRVARPGSAADRAASHHP
jgi:hypothetical protein